MMLVAPRPMHVDLTHGETAVDSEGAEAQDTSAVGGLWTAAVLLEYLVALP